MTIKLIVAVDEQLGIGKDGKLNWNNKEDLHYFKEKTLEGVVIMGRKTWDSIPEKYRPLPNRINVILTSKISEKNIDNCYFFDNVKDVLRFLETKKEEKFVIGGSSIYDYFLKNNLIDTLFITRIKGDYNCDTFFNFPSNFKLTETMRGNTCDFEKYTFVNTEELQYISLLKNIIDNGKDQRDRTGVGTKSLFCNTMKFNLRNNTIPLLTTKRVFFRGIVLETLFFLSGKTDTGILSKQGVKFWDANTSTEFIKSRGLSFNQGDMGNTYSFLYRHFGAEYHGMEHDYTNKGYDQVSELIRLIKTEPHSRRLIINLWNPCALGECTLPPCMFLLIFNVNETTKEINLQTNIRSSDACLGLPFNLINSTIILHLICRETGYSPGDLYVVTSDTHIYNNHLSDIQEQFNRTPTTFPKMYINSDKSIFDITYSDFELLNYTPQKHIKMDMVV